MHKSDCISNMYFICILKYFNWIYYFKIHSTSPQLRCANSNLAYYLGWICKLGCRASETRGWEGAAFTLPRCSLKVGQAFVYLHCLRHLSQWLGSMGELCKPGRQQMRVSNPHTIWKKAILVAREAHLDSAWEDDMARGRWACSDTKRKKPEGSKRDKALLSLIMDDIFFVKSFSKYFSPKLLHKKWL